MFGISSYLAIALSVVGLYIAAYFTLVYYKVIPASTSLMPQVCRLDERTCQTVLTTRYARVFGVPNSLLGIVYYTTVIVCMSGSWTSGFIGAALIAASWIAVALGGFLIYSLFFIIRIPCPLCITGHIINLALALLLTLSHG